MLFVGIIVKRIVMELEEKAETVLLQKLINSNSEVSTPGRAVHTFHSALHTSTDILPVDFEAMLNKIFQYFHIHVYIYIYIYIWYKWKN
jgi:hypothetical protein